MPEKKKEQRFGWHSCCKNSFYYFGEFIFSVNIPRITIDKPIDKILELSTGTFHFSRRACIRIRRRDNYVRQFTIINNISQNLRLFLKMPRCKYSCFCELVAYATVFTIKIVIDVGEWYLFISKMI